MKTIYRMFKRSSGIFYLVDKRTRKQTSLRTRDRAEAQKLVQAYNDTANQPIFNLALARVYMAGTDPKLLTRTWQEVMNYIIERRGGDTRRRWTVASRDKNFDFIRNLKVVETRPEDFDKVLRDGKASTNVYLRRLHKHALGMEWLLRPVLPKLLWPKEQHNQKRGITLEEHTRIVQAETLAAQRNQGSRNSDEPHYDERRDFYEFLWHTGASQSDGAFVLAENINWQQRTLAYIRRKHARRDIKKVKPAVVRFGDTLAAVLQRRPRTGPLFPYLRTVRAGDRATEFKQRCQALGIAGITLHCYRYGWAERALSCGYPERFAQQNLGHNSKAVHQAYAKGAEVIVPSLEDWQNHWQALQQGPLPCFPSSFATPQRPAEPAAPAAASEPEPAPVPPLPPV